VPQNTHLAKWHATKWRPTWGFVFAKREGYYAKIELTNQATNQGVTRGGVKEAIVEEICEDDQINFTNIWRS